MQIFASTLAKFAKNFPYFRLIKTTFIIYLAVQMLPKPDFT